METAEGDVQFRPRTGKAASAPLLPEVESYLQLLLVVHLTNTKNFSEVSAAPPAGLEENRRPALRSPEESCLTLSLSVCVCAGSEGV